MVCIEQGLPMVAIPLAGGDQPGNSARAAALGVARVVGPGERNAALVREAVLDILQDPNYRKNALRLKQNLRSLPAVDYAVGLLQRLANEKVPIDATQERPAATV
jgi:UDP:flavonoid glycosyltransferase YjiC (YdhE family)